MCSRIKESTKFPSTTSAIYFINTAGLVMVFQFNLDSLTYPILALSVLLELLKAVMIDPILSGKWSMIWD